MSRYRSPWWLPGGHLQTIYARYRCGVTYINYRRERWQTPDHDFIDLDWIDAQESNAKLLVVFHGLEGCSRSHYALTLMALARQRGWRGVVPHFRGCSANPTGSLVPIIRATQRKSIGYCAGLKKDIPVRN